MTSLKSTTLLVGPQAEHLLEAFQGQWRPLSPPLVSPHCLYISFLWPGRKRRYICILISHFSIFLIIIFLVSTCFHSVSLVAVPPPPFWEFTVTLPPPLWRGAQPLTLVPPSLLPVTAGLELSGYGDQSHSAPRQPSTPARDVLGYGQIQSPRLRSSGVRWMWRQRRKPVCGRDVCVCKHHGKMPPDLPDGLVGGEVKSERQGLWPQRLLIPS